MLRRLKRSLDAAAEGLELPLEAFGSLLVTVIGNGRVLIENHRGIEAYSAELIRLRSAGGSLAVIGSGLCIRILGKSKLALEGKIRAMEWEA